MLTAGNAKEALRKTISAVENSRQDARYSKSWEKIRDPISNMQQIFPMLVNIVADVIADYGFTRDGEGVVNFALAVKRLEHEDEELASLNASLQKLLIPKYEMKYF